MAPEYYSEKMLEPRLVKEIKKRGGRCVKWVSPGNAGVPDRIVLMPGGYIYFVELKSTGKLPTPLQKVWHRLLRQLKFEVYVIDNLPDLLEFVKSIRYDANINLDI